MPDYSHLDHVPPSARDVLTFWFGEQTDLDRAEDIQARNKIWFQGGKSFDEAIRERFGAQTDAALEGGFDDWEGSVYGELALILVLDQFPRNIFRGDAKAFAGDPRALALTKRLLAGERFHELHFHEQVFAAMPLQHSESIDDQERSVAVFDAIRARGTSDHAALFDNNCNHARMHRDIVAQFGRFPHRNAVLGRVSSDDESAYLMADAPRFGQ